MRRLLMFVAILTLPACAAKKSVLDEVAADRTIVTGAVGYSAISPEVNQDGVTIRNAVTSANLEQVSGGLAWANPSTGSRGTITTVGEYREQGVLCRRFMASRESYDGVALFRGDTCLGPDGLWWMRGFETIKPLA